MLSPIALIAERPAPSLKLALSSFLALRYGQLRYGLKQAKTGF